MKYLLHILFITLALAGCSGEDVSKENNETANSVSLQIRNIDLTTENNTYHLVAEANATEDELYYIIEQGENIIQNETKVTLNEGDWVSFEIIGVLEEETLQVEEPPIISVYGKDKNGERINSNYIPIDVEN